MSTLSSDLYYLTELAEAKEVDPNENLAKIQWNWKRVYKKLRKVPDWKKELKKSRTRPAKESKIWRDAVLNKYNHHCAICDSVLNLEAHHLESYHANEPLRFDPDNGAALCHYCHALFHKLFGKKYNTEAQYRIFYSIYK